MKYILLAILLWIIAGLAGYGIYGLVTYSDRLDLIESLQADNATLKNKVYWLRQANDYIPALEQFLNPLALDELRLLSEKIRQERNKK